MVLVTLIHRKARTLPSGMGSPGDLLPAVCTGVRRIYTDSHTPEVSTQPAACTQPVQSTCLHSRSPRPPHLTHPDVVTQPVHESTKPRPHHATPGSTEAQGGALGPISGGAPPRSRTRTHHALPEAAPRPVPAAQTESDLSEPGGAGAAPGLGATQVGGGTWARGGTCAGAAQAWVAPGLGAGTGLGGGTWPWGATG